jgi:hypothetical protein
MAGDAPSIAARNFRFIHQPSDYFYLVSYGTWKNGCANPDQSFVCRIAVEEDGKALSQQGKPCVY